jgi:acyl-coenzyme A synthetase/AMP-(fatty) acid ligase
MGSIREALADAPAGLGDRWLWAATARIRLAEAGAGTCLDRREALADRSVVVATRDPLAAALTLIELDGFVRRLLLCTPDVTRDELAPLAARAGADAIVTGGEPELADIEVPVHVRCAGALTPAIHPQPGRGATEWVLLTSGTAGAPKLVRHSFDTLTGAIARPARPAAPIVWGTFYDIRRYGGLQILLRALVGGGSLVLGSPDESVGHYLERLAEHGATHISGTPSHWRRVLMSPGAGAIAPRYIRLSGEIADQSVLDALRSRYPDARIAHAFASTEAGVGFEIDDGLAGFPASLAGAPGPVGVRVDDGALRIRSNRTALGYLGEAEELADPDGFVDTGDVVERRRDRYFFLGRRSGVINIGGLKVHPEEVEAAINRHPLVRMSRVRSKPSPITGALVTADVVLAAAAADDEAADPARVILQACRDTLPPHKVPALIRIVPALEIAPAGKLARHAT